MTGAVPTQALAAAAATAGAAVNPGAVRTLRRDLLSAADAKVLQVAALVDTLADRGAADALIAPLRPRLAQLRPRRPLQFTRLLFHPLDPMVVPPATWRADSIGVPRSVVAPLAAIVRQGLGADITAIEAMLAGRDQGDAAAAARAGARIWPVAARILASAAGASGPAPRCPPEWAATGLRDDMFGPIARTVAGMLALAVDIETLAECYASRSLTPEQQQDRAIALFAAAEQAGVRELCAAVLLQRLPAMPSLAAALALSASQGHALGRVLGTVLDRAERQAGAVGAALPGMAVGEAARELQRQADLLAALEALAAAGSTTDKTAMARLHTLRREAEASCRARLESGVREQFVNLLRDPPAAGAAIAALEDAARDLRRMEQVARTLNAPAGTLMDAARSAAGGAPHVRLVDRVRLTEILVGPEEAYRLMTGAQNRRA